MTQEEARLKLLELRDLVNALSDRNVPHKDRTPIFREILKDFEIIQGEHPCSEGASCIQVLKKLIDLYPEDKPLA